MLQERKLSKTELSEMVNEFRSDKPHPLDKLKVSGDFLSGDFLSGDFLGRDFLS